MGMLVSGKGEYDIGRAIHNGRSCCGSVFVFLVTCVILSISPMNTSFVCFILVQPISSNHSVALLFL